MRKVLLALLVLLTGATTAAAQATGTITGVVSDQSELVIPGVTIEATNTATNQTRREVTGADGFYTVTLLQPSASRPLAAQAQAAEARCAQSRYWAARGRFSASHPACYRMGLPMAQGPMQLRVATATQPGGCRLLDRRC